MIARSIEPELKRLLGEQAAVAIVGPRQVGKTTLAREVADGLPGSLYLDLEAREDRERLLEAKLFLGQYESVLVVLDEIHKYPSCSLLSFSPYE